MTDQPQTPSPASGETGKNLQFARRDATFIAELAKEWSYRLRHGNIETRKGCTFQFMDPRMSKVWTEHKPEQQADVDPVARNLAGLEQTRSVHSIAKQYEEALTRMQSVGSANSKQAFILTGEKATGKSSVRKHLISSAIGLFRADALREAMVHADALLEPFLHAATPRNDEESFSTYVFEAKVDAQQQLHSAEIKLLVKSKTYLSSCVEESQACSQTTAVPTEPEGATHQLAPCFRNFHIFYSLLCAVDRLENGAQLSGTLKLRPLSFYRILQADRWPLSEEETREYSQKFDEFQAALAFFEFTGQKGMDILRTVSAILLLANLRFEVKGPGSPTYISDKDALADVCTLLGQGDIKHFESLFCTTRVSPENKSLRTKKASIRQASQRRDVFINGLFSGIVSQLLRSVNRKIAACLQSPSPPSDASLRTIMIIDTRALAADASSREDGAAGLEALIEVVLRERLEEYFQQDMGLIPVGYSSVLGRIARRLVPTNAAPQTLLDLVDDCVKREVLMNDQRDEKQLCSEINLSAAAEGPSLLSATVGRGVDIIFPAVQLQYTFSTVRLVNDNQATLPEDFTLTLRKVRNALVKDVFHQYPHVTADERKNASTRVPATASAMLIDEVAGVLKALEGCKRYYIRCLRLAAAVPVETKTGQSVAKVDVDGMVRQMSSCGMSIWERQTVAAEVSVPELVQRIPEEFRQQAVEKPEPDEQLVDRFMQHIGVATDDYEIIHPTVDIAKDAATEDAMVRMTNRATQTYRTWKDVVDVQRGVITAVEAGLERSENVEAQFEDDTADDDRHEQTHNTLKRGLPVRPPTPCIKEEEPIAIVAPLTVIPVNQSKAEVEQNEPEQETRTPPQQEQKQGGKAAATEDLINRAHYGLQWASAVADYDLALALSSALRMVRGRQHENAADFERMVHSVLGGLVAKLPDSATMFSVLQQVPPTATVSTEASTEQSKALMTADGFVGTYVPTGGSYGQQQRLYYLLEKLNSKENVQSADPLWLLEFLRLAKYRLEHELQLPAYYQAPAVILRIVRVVALVARYGSTAVKKCVEELGLYELLVSFLSFRHCNKEVLLMVALFFRTATEDSDNHHWFAVGNGVRLLLHALRLLADTVQTMVNAVREDVVAAFCLVRTFNNLCKARSIQNVLSVTCKAQLEEGIYLPRLLVSLLASINPEPTFAVACLRLWSYTTEVYGKDPFFLETGVMHTLVRVMLIRNKEVIFLALSTISRIMTKQSAADEPSLPIADLALRHMLADDAASNFSAAALGLAEVLPHSPKTRQRLQILLPPQAMQLFDALITEKNELNLKKLYAWRKEMLSSNRSKTHKELIARIDIELAAAGLQYNSEDVPALSFENGDISFASTTNDFSPLREVPGLSLEHMTGPIASSSARKKDKDFDGMVSGGNSVTNPLTMVPRNASSSRTSSPPQSGTTNASMASRRQIYLQEKSHDEL